MQLIHSVRVGHHLFLLVTGLSGFVNDVEGCVPPRNDAVELRCR